MREKQNDTFILFCFFAFIVLLWIFLEKEHELREKQNDIFVMFYFFYFFGFSHKTIQGLREKQNEIPYGFG